MQSQFIAECSEEDRALFHRQALESPQQNLHHQQHSRLWIIQRVHMTRGVNHDTKRLTNSLVVRQTAHMTKLNRQIEPMFLVRRHDRFYSKSLLAPAVLAPTVTSVDHAVLT